jgi:rare lipoprotein A
MRHLLSAIAAATVLSVGIASAAVDSPQDDGERQQRTTKQDSKPGPDRQKPKRVRSHVSLHLSSHVVVKGESLRLRGKVRPSGRHRVKVVVRGADRAVVAKRTRANGTFRLRYSPESTGSYAVRAYGVHGARTAAGARTRGSRSKPRRLTAYRYAGASYYGPGLYGNGVACGGTLLPATIGVAHKTLPCGTEVKLRYRGRTATVPVIDRGPYVAGRDYDLTEALKNRLRFPGVGTVLASR